MLYLKDIPFQVMRNEENLRAKYDVIVVGGGLGGLTAGAKLAREGKKVLLIEQHDRPGGCATTFFRKGFTFEVGLHEMDGPGDRDLKTRIFNDLGLSDRITFLRVPEFYRFTNGRIDMVVPHNPEEVKKKLAVKFPSEEKGIDAYFHRLLHARQILRDNPHDQSLGAYLDRIIRNEDLKLILLGNLGYFSDDPYNLSLNYYSVAQGSYYSGGGSFILGGSQKLSDSLSSVITENGGKVLLNHFVKKIILSGNRATGVIIENKKDPGKKAITATAGTVVANAALPNLAGELLPPGPGNLLNEELKPLRPGPSLLSIYFGFRRPPAEAGHNWYSCFVFDPSVRSQKDIPGNNRGPFGERSYTFVDYSRVDPSLAPEGKAVGALCCIDYLSDWEHLSPREYREKKERVTQTFISRLDNLIPGIREIIEHCETGTARTVARYTLNPRGSVYGFERSPGMDWKGVIKTVENLHIASAWGKYGGGFSGAIYSGYMCALDILRNK